jgi:hypothetical protein
MKHAGLRFLLAGLPIITAVMLVADDSPRIKIQDDCQPATFNLDPPNGAGPGTCRANFDGETAFQKFIQQIIQNHKAVDWRFDDTPDHVAAGTTLHLRNEGGETHSFTRVQNFGGGIVPILNQLSGQTTLASECFGPNVGGTFVPSQARDQVGPTLTPTDRGKTIKFQCCIHPWMRTEVTVR